MGTLLFLFFHFGMKYNTEFDFAILCALVSLDTLSLLKALKLLRAGKA